LPRGERIDITITEDERQTLLMWVASTKKPYVQRAKAILLSADHLSLPEISKKSELSKQNCSKWRMRFLEGGIEALKDLPRKGRPPTVTSETQQKVMELGSLKRREKRRRWTMQSLAEATGLGRTTIHRILSQKDGTRHEAQYWTGKSTELEFVERQIGILGLCLNPVANGLVIGVVKKSPIQVLGQTQLECLSQTGNPMKDDNTLKSHGTNSLLATLSGHERVTGRRHEDKSDSIYFLNFLKRIYRDNPRQHIHIITEGNSLSQRKDIMDWIEKKRRLSVYYTPAYDSWMAQIEIWLNIFTRDVIPLGPWKSKKQVIDQILQYIMLFISQKGYPFSWTCSLRPVDGIIT
jgi:putative transposase